MLIVNMEALDAIVDGLGEGKAAGLRVGAISHQGASVVNLLCRKTPGREVQRGKLGPDQGPAKLGGVAVKKVGQEEREVFTCSKMERRAIREGQRLQGGVLAKGGWCSAKRVAQQCSYLC